MITTDNVGNSFTSPLVTNVRVDNTAPTLAVALASGPTGATKSGSTVSFKSDAAGSFAFVATVTDAGSGAASATFPRSRATGWTTHVAADGHHAFRRSLQLECIRVERRRDDTRELRHHRD